MAREDFPPMATSVSVREEWRFFGKNRLPVADAVTFLARSSTPKLFRPEAKESVSLVLPNIHRADATASDTEFCFIPDTGVRQAPAKWMR